MRILGFGYGILGFEFWVQGLCFIDWGPMVDAPCLNPKP